MQLGGKKQYLQWTLDLRKISTCIHQHKAFISDDLFLDSIHKSFWYQTTFEMKNEASNFY